MNLFSKLLVALAGGSMAAVATAETIATFADPALSGATPLFTYDSGTTVLTGQWMSTGLTLEVPSTLVGGPANYNDAMFQMTNLTVGAGGVTSGGKIDFFDSTMTKLFSISFDKALLSDPIFGASYLKADNVQFLNASGVPYNLDEEQFAFSFANAVKTGNVTTWTAAFTSSAVPEPTAMMLLLVGSISTLLRRR